MRLFGHYFSNSLKLISHSIVFPQKFIRRRLILFYFIYIIHLLLKGVNLFI